MNNWCFRADILVTTIFLTFNFFLSMSVKLLLFVKFSITINICVLGMFLSGAIHCTCFLVINKLLLIDI